MTAEKVIAQIRELHKPFKIWDECDCDADTTEVGYDETVPGHTYITEVGWTCNYMYSVCSECCCDDTYQSEVCATYHDHQQDQAICPTVAIITAAEVSAQPSGFESCSGDVWSGE